MKTSILDKAETAKEYYNTYKSKTLLSGFEKLIATDGSMCIFVNKDYEPENEDIIVFRLDTRNGVTGCSVHKEAIKEESEAIRTLAIIEVNGSTYYLDVLSNLHFRITLDEKIITSFMSFKPAFEYLQNIAKHQNLKIELI